MPGSFVAGSHSSDQMMWNVELFSNVCRREHFPRRSVKYGEMFDGEMATRKYFLRSESLKCCSHDSKIT